MPDVLFYEKEAWTSGFLRLAGIDEAGRGPLAGPVVAAAVVFDSVFLNEELNGVLEGLTDSKATTENRREEFFELLTNSDFVEIGLGIVEAPEIDRINILKATHKAMGAAAEEVGPDYILVDGLAVHGLPCASRNIIKGDALSISISAASIIAKVTRDRIMVKMDAVYPGYGFSDHKGYGTKAHLAALNELGPSALHRQSFKPVYELDQLKLDI
ncbi:MAG: ribonuclease HII [Kiritimatiellales bacterium]|nr:ribonuclease HII [Kiritimatiellales bacterium]